MSLKKQIEIGSIYWLNVGSSKCRVIAVRPMLVPGWWACRGPFPCADDDCLLVHEDSLSDQTEDRSPVRSTEQFEAAPMAT
jgi:hypothetical protein